MSPVSVFGTLQLFFDMFKCSFEFHPSNLLYESKFVADLSFQICTISHVNPGALNTLDQHEP